MVFPSPSLGIELEMSLEAICCRPPGQVQSGLRGPCTYHVSECINKIELLQDIESLWSAFSSPKTYLLQGSYGGDGRRRPNAWGITLKSVRQKFARKGAVETHE